jgi:hypothetical protein
VKRKTPRDASEASFELVVSDPVTVASLEANAPATATRPCLIDPAYSGAVFEHPLLQTADMRLDRFRRRLRRFAVALGGGKARSHVRRADLE